jgi:DNA-binding SARP family transcriptional activator
MGLRIRTLGALEIDIAGAAVVLPPGRRIRGLLAWLALHPGLHPRGRLAGWLWPEVPDPRARASLRSALWGLRDALGPHGSAFLITDRQSVGLRADGVSVDVAEFSRLAGAGRLREAVALSRGELLHEFEDDWVFEAREAHTRHLAAVLGRLAREAGEAGDAQAALDWSRQRAAVAPLDEEAGRDLVRRFAETDDVPGALAAYDRFRRRLRDQIGVAPARATRQLAVRVRAGRAGARRTG